MYHPMTRARVFTVCKGSEKLLGFSAAPRRGLVRGIVLDQPWRHSVQCKRQRHRATKDD
jgi:hypothetical protein